ncbi:MAG: hypothetical protein U0835_10010 [Isosphaeraceae bacterium]
MSRPGYRECLAHARWAWPAAWPALTGRIRGRSGAGEVHLLLAIADHFEPEDEGTTPEIADARVRHWVETYPEALGEFRDSDGRPPRHTFFYPVEVYDPGHVESLAGLCRAGFGEVEVHLHHDRDTAENLRRTLSRSVRTLVGRHGLLGRCRATGAPAYAFVHGNWALNNARHDGRWCGVNDEIRVLVETGCYADFTYPSAPGATQPPTVNTIYRAVSDPCRHRGHDHGVPVGRGLSAPEGSLLMIPGPLALNWRRRKRGVFPRVENACVQTSQPATAERLDLWLSACPRIPTRPDWYFVKLHAHGATERDRDALLGPVMQTFHRDLARRAEADPRFFFHYVSAREMANLALAAESGWTGPVDAARDFAYLWNGGRPCGLSPTASPDARSLAFDSRG